MPANAIPRTTTIRAIVLQNWTLLGISPVHLPLCCWNHSGGLEFNFHALSRGAHLRVVVARVLHDLVDHCIRVLGIMVEKDKLFGPALHDYVDGFAPMAV